MGMHACMGASWHVGQWGCLGKMACHAMDIYVLCLLCLLNKKITIKFQRKFGRKFRERKTCRTPPRCGQAGGKYTATHMGGDSAFTNTTFAGMGDLGSQKLPKGAAMAHWKAGAAVAVSWGIRYNHGGGYQYVQ